MKKKTKEGQNTEYWLEKYYQAKADGNTKLVKFYEAIILKLKGTIPKL